MSDCAHYVIRKSKERHPENVYVCGNCSKLFVVADKQEPEPQSAYDKNQPMIDRRPPWGLRNRQA